MSGLKIRWGGATVSPSQVKLRAGGSWADPAAVWVRASGAWVKVWPLVTPLSASPSPPTLIGARIDAGPLSETTTITASGGVAPYSYSTIWSSGGAGLTVINGGSNTPGASGSEIPYTIRDGTLRCRVTDSASNYVDVFIDVSFSWGS